MFTKWAVCNADGEQMYIELTVDCDCPYSYLEICLFKADQSATFFDCLQISILSHLTLPYIFHFLGIQRKILEKLFTIEEQNQEIISILKTQKNSTGSNIISFIQPNLPVELPIKNLDDVQVLERFLNEKRNFEELVSHSLNITII